MNVSFLVWLLIRSWGEIGKKKNHTQIFQVWSHLEIKKGKVSHSVFYMYISKIMFSWLSSLFPLPKAGKPPPVKFFVWRFLSAFNISQPVFFLNFQIYLFHVPSPSLISYTERRFGWYLGDENSHALQMSWWLLLQLGGAGKLRQNFKFHMNLFK